MEPILRALNLHKTYPVGDKDVMALRGVDIDVQLGQTYVLLGPSGAGKTTLLHVLSGLDRPTKGNVLLDGVDMYELSDSKLCSLRAKSFGFIFQAYNLVANLTIQENVEIPLRIAGTRDSAKLARHMLERVGLADRLNHRPGQLSGGEQQRASVARALVVRPRVIFADEPTGNLDSTTGQQVIGLLTELTREEGAACVMVTHNTAWTAIADKSIFVKDGKLEVEASA